MGKRNDDFSIWCRLSMVAVNCHKAHESNAPIGYSELASHIFFKSLFMPPLLSSLETLDMNPQIAEIRVDPPRGAHMHELFCLSEILECPKSPRRGHKNE